MELLLETLHSGELHEAMLTESLTGPLNLFDTRGERDETTTCTEK